MTLELFAGMAATAALGLAGWAVKEVIKVPSMEEDIKYIRGRLDSLYDRLLTGPRS